ncbi:MAG: hypothetical protein EXQ56_01955 [Acidobacteria bacterium]|nr:hypothetical protein [Acidobacteriota bacterium]
MLQRSGTQLIAWMSITLILLSAAESHALPAFMRRFSEDPFSKTEWRGQCATCHVNPQGAGPRNNFGQAFDKNNRTITPEFRAAWLDRFVLTIDVAPAGAVKASFVNGGREAVIEVGGESFRVNAAEGKLEKLTLEQVAQLKGSATGLAPATASAAAPTEQPLRNVPTFDHVLVNVPTTLGYEKGGFSLRFTHRFTQPVLRVGDECPDCGAVNELFGLDSFSYSSFGGEFGLTSRLAASVYRSPLDRTYEIGGVLQLLNGKGREPVAAQLRVSMESRRLFDADKISASTPNEEPFSRFQTWNLVFPVSRTIANVAEVFVVPTMSFRVNPYENVGAITFPEGERCAHQAALGLGASIRIRPRTAFVAEWTPRVAGYHATDSRNGFAFGLQRSTNAHVFSLVLSNTVATTTGQMAATGTPDLRLGFNLYRRLR